MCNGQCDCYTNPAKLKRTSSLCMVVCYVHSILWCRARVEACNAHSSSSSSRPHLLMHPMSFMTLF